MRTNGSGGSDKDDLSAGRLTLLRAGYVLVGLGLALVKWPKLPDAHAMPLYDGVTLCMLTAMSLLALLGVLRPIRFLPVLLFEVTWKLLWMSLVALPQARHGRLDDSTRDVLTNSTLVVLVIAVIPWAYVWRAYLQPRRPTRDVSPV